MSALTAQYTNTAHIYEYSDGVLGVGRKFNRQLKIMAETHPVLAHDVLPKAGVQFWEEDCGLTAADVSQVL